MRLDEAQVVIRPRGVLECLDLALLVCGRRPVGVAVAAALGAVPMILLNRYASAGAERESSLAAFMLLTALEMPWAAAPLTLFLGQAVFSRRFTATSARECLRAAAGALGPMLLYQTLLRGLAFVTCIGALVWMPAAYYLEPVILLERGRTAGVPGRCLTMTRCSLDRIPLLLVIDAAVLVVGWLAGTWFLETFASLWRGGTLDDVARAAFDPFAEDGDAALAAVQAFASWPSQIAFWAAAMLVTVYRFFTYLDARIRHEGWDVELKFRAAATYAGLRPGRAALGAALLVGCLAAASARAAAAPPAEAESAVAAAAATADPARDAVVKQRFPWYDAAADAYRPMVRAEPPPSSARDLTLEGLGDVAKGVMILALATLVAGAVWLLVRFGLDRPAAVGSRRAAAAAVLGAEALAALPEAARRHDGDLLVEAERLAAAGDYAAAMVLFHGWQLVQLHGRGVLELARGKTTRRYATEVAAAAPPLDGLFRRSNTLFEDALFGRLPVAAADFADVWDRRAEFLAPPADKARVAAVPVLVLVVALAAGCDRDPDTRYGTVRGESLNGVSAFVQLLRDAGHQTATRRWLAERIVARHDVAIVFADEFTAPEEDARRLLERFLDADGNQTLVFVARDSDAAIDYWQAVAAARGLPPEKMATAQERHATARAELVAATQAAFAADTSDRSPLAYGLAARDRPVPPPIDVDVAGTTAAPVAARWELRRRLEPPRGMRPLWTHGGEPLLVASRGRDRTLLLASAAPLLNGGLVDPGNRRLAAALVAELPPEARVVVVGSARIRAEEDDESGPSLWRLLAVQPHPWIVAQAVVAMLLFCWWKAPIFGRPRREEDGRPQDFGHHVEALGALLLKSRDEAFAHTRLEAWRRGDRDGR